MVTLLHAALAWCINKLLGLFNISPLVPGPSGTLFKCSMFFPAGSNPWPTNQGVDSALDWASCHGAPWEKSKRWWCYDSIRKCGGDTLLFISERLYGFDVPHLELQMFLTNRAHPTDGHRMNDRENEVVIARSAGVTRWIVDLFNDESTLLPWYRFDVGMRNYIGQMAECYKWATRDQVAFMVCLECEDRFAAHEAAEIARWIKQAAPDKRIIVGSQSLDYLRQISSLNPDAELWLESPGHPFQLDMCVDQYLSQLRALTASRRWAGEYGRGQGTSAKRVTAEAQKMGVAGIGSFVA